MEINQQQQDSFKLNMEDMLTIKWKNVIHKKQLLKLWSNNKRISTNEKKTTKGK